MRKTPQSRFEKLHAGMKLLMQYQPAAVLDVCSEGLMMGTEEDPHLPRGAKEFLFKLGFTLKTTGSEEKDNLNTFFVFPVQNEKNSL